MTADDREAVRYRIPAASLRKGDIVDTGDDDWQQVVGVYASSGSARSDEIRGLVETVGSQYVVAQLTSIAPVDSDVFFVDGVAMVYGEGEEEVPVTDVVSTVDGVRTYLYTKFELVTVRGDSA